MGHLKLVECVAERRTFLPRMTWRRRENLPKSPVNLRGWLALDCLAEKADFPLQASLARFCGWTSLSGRDVLDVLERRRQSCQFAGRNPVHAFS